MNDCSVPVGYGLFPPEGNTMQSGVSLSFGGADGCIITENLADYRVAKGRGGVDNFSKMGLVQDSFLK